MKKILFFSIVIIVALIPRVSVSAVCPDFPSVPWWKGLSHASETKHVNQHYNGDWAPYIARWKSGLEKVQSIYDRGSAVLVTKENIRLADESLRTYINRIEQRVNTLECLSKANSQSAKLDDGHKNHMQVERGRILVEKFVCTRCHGAEGKSGNPQIPNLFGQNADYLVKQLIEFKKPAQTETDPYGPSERHHRIMDVQAKRLSTNDIWDIGAYYYSKGCQGEMLTSTANIPGKAIRCMKCHGPSGESVFPEIPNLAGQKKLYLEKQIKNFRATSKGIDRKNTPDERYNYIMAKETQFLEDSDVKEIAAYFSSFRCSAATAQQ